jgi:gluconate 2-dehydrogenase alpha chain
MATRIHASWRSHQHLNLEPAYKGAYGLPLLRMTFDWHGNDRALNFSGPGGENKGTRFCISGYQSTRNVGGVVTGSDPSTSVVNTYPRAKDVTYPRSKDVSKPFVVGGSAFPRNPANGPPGQSVCWPVGRPMQSKKTTFANPGSLV